MDSFDKITQGMPLISVIVPVYNVEQYLGPCLDSILAQTYTNTQIFLVDDGSTDGSGQVCDAYARKDARIRVVHQQNRGPSCARNAGLDLAEGEYISFVDADDLVKKDFLMRLYGLAVKYGADIAACLFEERGPEAEVSDTDLPGKTGKELCLTSETLLKNWHGKYKKYETIAWNKLYRRKVFETDPAPGRAEDGTVLRFPEGRLHEDVLTAHLFVQNADKIALTDCALYLYRKRAGSIKHGTFDKAYADRNLAAQRERMQFFQEKKYYRSCWNLLEGYLLHRVWFALKKALQAGKKKWTNG